MHPEFEILGAIYIGNMHYTRLYNVMHAKRFIKKLVIFQTPPISCSSVLSVICTTLIGVLFRIIRQRLPVRNP